MPEKKISVSSPKKHLEAAVTAFTDLQKFRLETKLRGLISK
jgi:hypothetical protein